MIMNETGEMEMRMIGEERSLACKELGRLRWLLVAAVMLPGVAAAQAPCREVGTLGIGGLECVSCAFAIRNGGREWSFGTEPEVLAVSEDSPAHGALEAGDKIVAIDGIPITTREGGRHFGSPEPGAPVRLEVRRDGARIGVAFVTGRECAHGEAPEEPSTPRVTEVQRAATTPGVAVATGGVSLAALDSSSVRLSSILTGLSLSGAPRLGPMAYLHETPIWLGFGIRCSNCSLEKDTSMADSPWQWRFSPQGIEVKSVARSGPAERGGLRAGDRIVSIDGVALGTEEGDRVFSSLRAGQVASWGILRGGQARTVRFAPEARDSDGTATAGRRSAEADRDESTPVSVERALRFGGRIGNTRVEVRGPPDVLVEMDQTSRWVVIRVGEYEVRVRQDEIR